MDDKTKRLTEVLPESILEDGSVPFAYYLMRDDAPPAPTYRAVQSTLHRASSTHCMPFYKPISRCLRGDR